MPMPAASARRMKSQRFDVIVKNARAGDRRHPETLPYRCCLSTLAGFERLCRAGPARTVASIIEVRGDVKSGDREEGSEKLCLIAVFFDSSRDRQNDILLHGL